MTEQVELTAYDPSVGQEKTGEESSVSEKVFVETDNVKIFSVDQPSPKISDRDFGRVEKQLGSTHREDIFQVSSSAFYYGGYILKGKKPVISSNNSKEVFFYEHGDLLDDCYNAIPTSDSGLRNIVQILKDLDVTGFCNGKGFVLEDLPFNCFVSFNMDVPYMEILRIAPVVVIFRGGGAQIIAMNRSKEIHY